MQVTRSCSWWLTRWRCACEATVSASSKPINPPHSSSRLLQLTYLTSTSSSQVWYYRYIVIAGMMSLGVSLSQVNCHRRYIVFSNKFSSQVYCHQRYDLLQVCWWCHYRYCNHRYDVITGMLSSQVRFYYRYADGVITGIFIIGMMLLQVCCNHRCDFITGMLSSQVRCHNMYVAISECYTCIKRTLRRYTKLYIVEMSLALFSNFVPVSYSMERGRGVKFWDFIVVKCKSAFVWMSTCIFSTNYRGMPVY